MQEYVMAGLTEARSCLAWLCNSREAQAALDQMVTGLIGCFQRRGKVLTCGNGGSFCDAAHLAEEFAGRFKRNRPALAGLCLSDGAFLTCAANDFGFEQVYERGVEALGSPGDILVAFSTSGNSPNIVKAALQAHQMGIAVYGLLGKDGGRLKDLCDCSIIVPTAGSDRIQEIHVKVVHLLVEGVERALFPGNYEEAN